MTKARPPLLAQDPVAETPDAPVETQLIHVGADAAGERLDAFLARHAGGLSRSRIKTLVKEGQVSAGGAVVTDPSRKVVAGEILALGVPAPVDADPEAEDIPLTVLYEDDDLIVIDKPAGLVVHPGAGNPAGTLVNALLAHAGDSLSGIGGVRRPGIVHRLDKDTSGVLVVAKNDAAHQALSAQFADHGREGSLLREYDALVWGVPRPHIGTVDAPLTRDPKDRRRQMVTRVGGREAITHYELQETFGGGRASLVTCTLETGRTHQIRVHMAHIGHPLVGDLVYGSGFLTKADSLPEPLAGRVRAFRRQALHARLLAFDHPRTGKSLELETDWPADLTDLVELFRKLAV